MQYVLPPVATWCVGQAASMASLLLTAGSPGMRHSLPNSRIMVHQPSGHAAVSSASPYIIGAPNAVDFGAVYELRNTSCRSQWSSGSTLACCARGPRFESRCGQKFVFSRKSLRYAALGTGCTLTAVPRSTQPSTLRGTVNEYQPCG